LKNQFGTIIPVHMQRIQNSSIPQMMMIGGLATYLTQGFKVFFHPQKQPLILHDTLDRSQTGPFLHPNISAQSRSYVQRVPENVANSGSSSGSAAIGCGCSSCNSH
jgi:hypothetical protein